MRHTTVAEVMNTRVLSVDEHTEFTDVAFAMYMGSVRALPVLDGNRALVGVISEADVLVTAERSDPTAPKPHWWRHRPRHTHRHAPEGKAGARTARELMTSDVVTVGPATTVAQAARSMREKGLSWLPVVDAGGRVIGVLGRSDLLAVFLRDDCAIRTEIVEEVLRHIPPVDPRRVVVEVADGVVTLTGQLDTHADTALVVQLVEGVEGVVSVVSHLHWRVDERVPDTTVAPVHHV